MSPQSHSSFARRRTAASLLAALATSALLAACSTKTEDQSAPAGAGTQAGGQVAAAPAGGPHSATAALPDTLTVTVYKSPSCGCCKNWVEHMRANGFRVATVDRDEFTDVKREHGVGEALESCHTALVGGYVVEGHVPAADVRRLLLERPAVLGIAAPGMPMGSPGMEGPRTDRYDVVSFDKSGATKVFASH
ncbi:MAG: DUF411 domain-containing protein [Gemmatimonadaceae bacterium]